MRFTKVKVFKQWSTATNTNPLYDEVNRFLAETFIIENKEYEKHVYRNLEHVPESITQLERFILIYEEVLQEDVRKQIAEEKKFMKELERTDKIIKSKK